MIYASLALILPALWWGSWWLLIPLSLLMGYLFDRKEEFRYAIGAGLAWAALAYIRDGELGGIVSGRVGKMLMLPWPPLVFLVIALFGFVTAWLWFRTGVLFKRSAKN